MRLVTGKYHRAFPLLDDLDDEQCARLLGGIRSRLFHTILRSAVMIVTMAGSLIAVTTYVVSPAFEGVESVLVRVLGRPGGETAAMALAMVFVFAVSAIAGLIARDLAMAAHVRVAIGRRLRRLRCLSCDYPLFRQRAIDGRVTCPECGMSATLEQLGIHPSSSSWTRAAGRAPV